MHNRRDILKIMSGAGGARLLAGSGATSILHMLVQGYFSKLYAQSQGVLPRKFIDIHIQGGYPAHFMYLPLRPRTTDSFNFNTWTATGWDSTGPIHRTMPCSAAGQTYELPPVWGVNVPRTAARGGGSMPSTAVLQRSIFMRGLWNAFDSHGFGWLHKSRPSPSSPSITGMVADAADSRTSPITALGILPLDTMNYASKKVALKVMRQGGNYIQNIMNPVIADTQMRNLLATRDGFSTQFNAALEAVARDAGGIRDGAPNILASVASAEQLLRRDFGNLVDRWASLKGKYEALMSASTNLSGIFPVGITPVAGSIFRRVEGDDVSPRIASNADLLTSLQATSRVNQLAENFATLEFLMEEGLSHMVYCELGGTSLLNIPTTTNGAASGTVTDHGIDQHVTGIGMALALNTFHSRALLACMNEFVLRMNELNKMDEITMRVSSDFSRASRHTGSGSDHGWQANAFLLVSGAIRKPQVVGNLVVGGSTGDYRGTWGVGGLVNHEGSPINLKMGHAVSSVAVAARVASPVANFEPVLSEGSTGIVSAIGEGTTGST